jgi:hypothetical protein
LIEGTDDLPSQNKRMTKEFQIWKIFLTHNALEQRTSEDIYERLKPFESIN